MNTETAPIRVLLVDDEELARMRLRGLVEECVQPRCYVAGEAGNAAQALVWLQSTGLAGIMDDDEVSASV